MKIMNYINLFGIAGLLTIFAACSDNNDYTPGPEVSANCQQVRFVDTNNPISVRDAANTADRTVTLTVKRNNTGASLTVPVKVIAKSEGLEIPTEVTFSAGDSLASYVIKAPQSAKFGEIYQYEIRLEGDNIDPYKQLDGGALFSGQVNFPKSTTATFWFANGSKGGTLFDTWTETLMDLGNNCFYIKDFMHSGENLSITTSSTGTMSFKSDAWTPACIRADNSEAGCYYYYFQKLHGGSLSSYALYPKGNDSTTPYITEMMLYGGPTYSTYHTNGTWGQTYVGSITYSTGDSENWIYLYFQLS